MPKRRDYSVFMTIEKPKSEKELAWEKKIAEVEKITDGLGYPIDGGIKNAVAAFNLSGFPTDGSCEGHTEGDHGEVFPWIDVSFPEPEEWRDNENEQKKWRMENLVLQKNILGLLEEFYMERKTPMELRLMPRYIGAFGAFRIQSVGADLSELVPPAELKAYHSRYKAEMDAFTDFLKERYFAS